MCFIMKLSCSPISSSQRQHFVDPQDVEMVDADPGENIYYCQDEQKDQDYAKDKSDVEGILTTVLHTVLVATNPGSLEGLVK